MVSRTYADVKEQLAEISGITGYPVTDARLKQQLNLAQEEAINEGDWPGVVDRWKIVATSGEIVLPSHLDRLMQITIRGVPVDVKSPWFSFVAYGPGIQDDETFRCRDWVSWGHDGGILEVGEVCSQIQLPFVTNGSSTPQGPWNLRVYASVEEADGIFATVQGTLDGEIVRTQLSDGSATWINGERISITNGSSYSESVQQFDELTAFTKPETNGYVRLTAWNGSEELELSNYAPGETTPSYHKYYSPWLHRITPSDGNSCCRTVIARCRRRFVPVAENTDVLIISNLPALRVMMMAIGKRDAGNFDEYAVLKTTAVDLLRKEASSYRGKARTPSLVFQRGFAIGTLPPLR